MQNVPLQPVESQVLNVTLDEQLWTVAAARVLLGADWHVQAPPILANARAAWLHRE